MPTFKSPTYHLPKKYEHEFFCSRPNPYNTYSKLFKGFHEEITGVCATPARNYLLNKRKDGRMLKEEQAEAFHHTVYQLLFAANRGRRDSQTAVSFLTMQVKDPDEDDWGKLVRVLK
jgi:hypothetical protein